MGVTPAAWAADGPKPGAYPTVEVKIPIEIQADRFYGTQDDTDRHDVFAKIEPEVVVRFGGGFSIEAGLTLEEVVDPDPASENRVFEDEGLYIETLKANYEYGRFAVFGGKFTADFGIAHKGEVLPGIYSRDMAEDYELTERVGVGGTAMLADGDMGKHALSAGVFYLDTTSFSKSAFRNRGRRRPTGGGPSNTESLKSFTVALEGENVAGVKDLHYHLSGARQGVDRVNDEDGVAKAGSATDDETGFAAAVHYRFAVGKVGVAPVVEWVRLNDFGGDTGVDRTYVTAGLGAELDQWNAALAWTRRHTDNPSSADAHDYQLQVSAGYRFKSGIGVEVGWKQSKESELLSRTVGALLTYEYAF